MMIARLNRAGGLLCLSLLAPAVPLVVPVPAHAVELVRWERIPLPVTLHVGEERIVFVEKNVRVGFPPALNGKLRVQSTGGAVYLRAESAFEQTRLQLQDVETGEMLLLDVSTTAGKGTLEPLRVVYSGEVTRQDSAQSAGRSGAPVAADAAGSEGDGSARTKPQKPRHNAPLPVVLTRYAAQSLYAPLRTVEAAPGVQSVPLPLPATLTTLYPSEPVTVKPLAGWRASGYSVVALKVTNQSAGKVVLDPRRLQGTFVTATFQHRWLGGKGTPEDTTTLYLVVKGKPENAFIAGPVKPVVKKPPKKASSVPSPGGNKP